MKKIFIAVLAGIATSVFLLALFSKTSDPPTINEINRKHLDNAALANAETERKFIENRILGISYLASVYVNKSSTLPAAFRDRVLDDRQILSDTKKSLEAVIAYLDEGDTLAANNAYQLIETKTAETSNASYQRRNKIRDDFRDALNQFYRDGRVYTEGEWETLKFDLRHKLTDRDTEVARKAYLMQPADNRPFNYLKDQLEALGETEQLLFFCRLNYEIAYKLLKNYGSLSSALDYGVALNRYTDQTDKVTDVLKGPVSQILSESEFDATRYAEPLKAYFSALKKQGEAQEFERSSQIIVNSVRKNILALDGQALSADKISSLIPSVKADFRVQGATLLNELGIIDDAVLLLEDAKNLFETTDTQEVAQISALIEQYQQNLKQE